jgi:hypothetical protein
MQVLLVEFKNGHVVRFAEARRTSGDDLKHGLQCARRSTDSLKNLGCGRLLFLRLVQFAAKPRDLSFLTSNGGIATARSSLRLRAIASLLLALERRRIAHPKAQDYADFQGGLQQGFAIREMGFGPKTARRQSETVHVRFGSIVLKTILRGWSEERFSR